MIQSFTIHPVSQNGFQQPTINPRKNVSFCGGRTTYTPPQKTNCSFFDRIKGTFHLIALWLQNVWRALLGYKSHTQYNLEHIHKNLTQVRQAFLDKHPKKKQIQNAINTSITQQLQAWQSDLQKISQAKNLEEFETQRKAFLEKALPSFSKLIPDFPYVEEDKALLEASAHLYKIFLNETQYGKRLKLSELMINVFADWSAQAVHHPNPQIAQHALSTLEEFLPPEKIRAIKKEIQQQQTQSPPILRRIREEVAYLQYLVKKL